MKAMLIFLVSFALLSANGKPNINPPMEQEVKVKVAWLTKPFDPTMVLGPNVKGHDFNAIYEAEQKWRKEAKEEFETTPAFEERRKKLRYLTPHLRLDDQMAFIIKMSGNYDADSQSLQVKRTFDHVGYTQDKIESKDRVGMAVELRSISDEKVVMQNGYGVKLIVRDRILLQGLLVVDTQSLGIPKGPEIAYEIPMLPNDARKHKGNIALLVVGRISQTAEGLYEPDSTPTVEQPRRTSIFQHIAQFDLKYIWIINQTTGAILKKFDQTL